MTNHFLLATTWASRSGAEQASLIVHISAGALGLLTGFAALSATKGAPLHRKFGVFFVYSMLAMSLMGAATAAIWSRAAYINVAMGFLTAYLVVSSLAAVRQDSFIATRNATAGLMLFPIGIAITLATFGYQVSAGTNPALRGWPSAPFFVFAAVAMIAVVSDVKIIRAGGAAALTGSPRITQHLWRMCLALLIAAFSFFLGQAKVIPKAIRIYPLLMIPPMVVLGAMLYWLWRVRFRKSLNGLFVSRGAVPAAASA